MGVCLAIVVAAAVFLGIFLVVDNVFAMVSINKINPFSCYAGLPSSTSAPTSAHHYRDPFFSAPQLSLHVSTSFLKPPVLSLPALARQLLLWRWFDSSASTWDPGLSLFYLRRRLQQHPSVAGMNLLRWLYRPTLNRRYARSVHPGASVFDAPVAPRRWIRPPRRHRRCRLLI